VAELRSPRRKTPGSLGCCEESWSKVVARLAPANQSRIDGDVVGEVTSGNFSPVLEQGIALAFLPPDTKVGAAVRVEARRDLLEGVVVKLPFLG